MTDADRLRLRGWVKLGEGLKLHAYQDSLGFWTLGYGRLIDATKGGGISKDEAEYLLGNDLKRMERECEKLPAYLDLSPSRQAVLIEMCFILGPDGLRLFKRMFKALAEQDYAEAADCILASKMAGQIGARAVRLAEQLKTGRWAVNALSET